MKFKFNSEHQDSYSKEPTLCGVVCCISIYYLHALGGGGEDRSRGSTLFYLNNFQIKTLIFEAYILWIYNRSYCMLYLFQQICYELLKMWSVTKLWGAEDSGSSEAIFQKQYLILYPSASVSLYFVPQRNVNKIVFGCTVGEWKTETVNLVASVPAACKAWDAL